MKIPLNKILNTPYPFYFRGRTLWQFGLIIFLLAFLFNYFFTPFNVNIAEHRMSYFWISVVHSAVPVLVLIVLYPFIHFSPSLDDRWTIGKDLLFLSLYLLLIGIGQFLVRDLIYDNPNNWSWAYLREEIGNTFLVGILLVGLIISVNFNRLNARYIREAQILEKQRLKRETQAEKASVSIETQVKSDRFDLEVDKFLFAKAEGNYLMVFLREEHAPTRILKRISISEFEKQVRTLNEIFRTHRSYIVNLAFLRRVKGNAQGYQLNLEHCDAEIPVSRNMIPAFEKRLKN
jgi:hypothetical protein